MAKGAARFFNCEQNANQREDKTMIKEARETYVKVKV